ncbi:MAG: hypothetical protein EB053_04105 [Chlamydiae bacterium]|nr:hypothetical protein [Chlamydiota bacterium]
MLDRLVFVADNRINPDFIQQEAKGAKFQPPLLEENLAQGDWMPLMKGLWSDEEGIRALHWLRENEKKILPLLLYEQSIQEFFQTPTLSTASKTSIPLIVAATLKLKQHESFIQKGALLNDSVADIFQDKYLDMLNQLLGRFHKISLPELILSTDCASHIFQKVHQFNSSSILPKPREISWLMRDPLNLESLNPVDEWPKLGREVVQSWVKDWTMGASSLNFFDRDRSFKIFEKEA